MLISTALGSFGLGALVSWAVVSDRAERNHKVEFDLYRQLVQIKNLQLAELGQAVEELRQSRQVVNMESNIAVPIEEIKEEEEVEEEEEEPVDLYGETEEETRTNLQRIINEYSLTGEQAPEIERVAALAAERNETQPFVISRESFAYDEDYDNYDKITLTYYSRDRVLLDSEEDVITTDDVARMVGWRNLSQFGGESGDPDVVFVRNHRLRVDFEVVREEDTPLPLHVTYGMEKEEFRVNKAAGLIKLRPEDDDH